MGQKGNPNASALCLQHITLQQQVQFTRNIKYAHDYVITYNQHNEETFYIKECKLKKVDIFAFAIPSLLVSMWVGWKKKSSNWFEAEKGRSIFVNKNLNENAFVA